MNTIVITLQGCPVGALGFYGNEWIATPNLDRLASESTVFDRHFSDCPTLQAAHQAWRTGRQQTPLIPDSKPGTGPVSAVTSTATSGTQPDTGGDLVAILRAAGVHTVLIQNTRALNDPAPNFYAGWDERFVIRPAEGHVSPMESVFQQLPAILESLRKHDRWCLWFELDRLITPWDIPQEVFDAYIEDLFEEEPAEPSADSAEESDTDSDPGPTDDDSDDDAEAGDDGEEDDEEDDEEKPVPTPREPVLPWHNPMTGWFDVDDLVSWELLHRSFAAALTTLDADLGRLFDLLRDRGIDQSATWFLTADRGQPLGEHGIIGTHRPWLHEELVHLPLVLRQPHGVEAGRRVSIFTQPPDLMPTILAAHGLTVSTAGIDGFNLLPYGQGETRELRSFVCTGLVEPHASEWAIRTADWAYLLPVALPLEDDDEREPLLYEKPDDRWEVNDLRVRNLGHADDLEKMLRDAVNKPKPTV